jgi:hypothetical protein
MKEYFPYLAKIIIPVSQTDKLLITKDLILSTYINKPFFKYIVDKNL